MKSGIAALAACCVAGSAQAADNGFYLGIGAEHSDFRLAGASGDPGSDTKDKGIKLLAGVRLLDSFGVELNYADHGKAKLGASSCPTVVGPGCTSPTGVSAKTTAAYAVGFVDFPLLDLFAKAGLARMDGKVSTNAQPSVSYSDNDTKLAWGIGAQAHFGSLGARAEIEQFKLFGEKLRTLSISFVYTIL
jgi:opacity protein-like surface antigen